MATKIFVNLHVRDLNASIDFFTKLGFGFDPEFTNDDAGSMVIDEGIHALLVTEPFFTTITDRRPVDTAAFQEAAIALDVDSRERVDELADAAEAAGGLTAGEPIDDGFMYSRGFRDLDGHLWNVLHMPATA
ncbi:VOC family protein [Thermoactinospora rubra]|uniref:VOC family protein n=1 Tax=Thermoactinospora rubra TaxID=1088767 RepID=UPI000A1167AE|nr:VOC family protein [Thermoactinospora rubra]